MKTLFRQSLRWMALVAAFLVEGSLPASLQAQTITLSGSTTSTPFREYATRDLGDPWDMSQRTDLGWLTWSADQPQPNMTDLAIATDGSGNTFFTGSPSSADPSFFLLDTFFPGSSKLGKSGANFPIDTTVYTSLVVKMKFGNQILAPQFGTVGVPVVQVFWSRDTIFFDASSRPAGGSITTANSGNTQVGIPLNVFTSEPTGAVEGGNWVIYRFPLTFPELATRNPGQLDHWENVAGGSDSNWGTAGVNADSLRFKPINMSSSVIGAVQIDWARLENFSVGSPLTVNWTGGATFDVIVSTQANCSDYGVVAYSVTSGFQFQPQMLPPGTYRVGLRNRFLGSTGQSGGVGSNPVSCSAGTFTVQSLPSLTLTSPNPEGSSDDFATTFLNNPWDFDALTDVDFSRNFTFPDANFGIVNKTATDPAGNDLGSVRVFRGRSDPGTPATGGFGDPHIYPLWPFRAQPGARFRGMSNRIDTTRYRLLTIEAGVERTRDLLQGSIARVIWHVADDLTGGGAPAEIESEDIVLRHLEPTTQNNGKIVLDTLQMDMADRASLPFESDGVLSTAGWKNNCIAPVGCASGPTHKPGVDLFRFDFHEFAASTNFYIRRIKLAALEQTGNSFQIQWNGSNPSALAATVTLRAVPVTNPGADNFRPIDRTCAGGSTFLIASGVSFAGGSFTWNPSLTPSIPNGSDQFICALIVVSGQTVDEIMSTFPIRVNTSFTGLKPRLFMDHSVVRFAGVHTGQPSPVFSSKTAPETIRTVQLGAGVVNWTATVTDVNGNPANWISVSPSSGSGGDTFVLSLVDAVPLASCTAVDGLGATLKVTSANTSNDPQFIEVLVTIFPGATASPPGGCTFTPGVTGSPFGQVDTPAQNASGVVGAIGVTGWVLDDVGVNTLQIFRNCLGFEPQAACQIVNGQNVVFVGDAAFLPGARPDVEAAFPTVPRANVGGWGFLMLTNMLPHVTPSSQVFGGQGPLTLFVFATDAEGHRVLLGRSQLDSTPTSITMANDTIAKPFGAIDTPGQGVTVSGTLPNFGWSLTPDSNTVADGTDIVIPTNGSTSFVFIDALAVAAVNYNHCRGSVGTPPPPGVFCDDDVANIFGNPTPQPTFTTRTSNPTRFRNLDAGRGAIGVHVIDTTAMTNGLHTIAWSVTDNNGRVEGIGSRFFIVLNGSNLTTAELAAAPLLVVGDAAEVSARPVGVGAMWGRRGFDLASPWESIQADGQGVRHVTIADMGRLELWLGDTFVSAGYLEANGTLRALPPGSGLDQSTGVFRWMPGPGYLGNYDLVFLQAGERVPVRVTVQPQREAPGLMRATIDIPSPGATTGGAFTVAGWALDLGAWQGSGVGAVHVWAERTDAPAAPVFLGAAALGGLRPDVAADFGPGFDRSGWNLSAAGLAPGRYAITTYFWSTRTRQFEDARTVTVTVR